jgi:hypothetical protein
MENEGDDERPSSGLKASYNLAITPTTITSKDGKTGKATPNDVITALNNVVNYGMYMSNLRTRFSNDYDKEFGTVYDRRAGRKPPVTKDMENEFYSDLLKKKKIQLLFPTVEKDTVVFYQKDNSMKKDVIDKMVKTVLKNAGIEYTSSTKES